MSKQEFVPAYKRVAVEVAALREENLSLNEIAARVGVSVSVVAQARVWLRLPRKAYVHARTRVVHEQARRLRNEGMTFSEIAKQCQCSITTAARAFSLTGYDDPGCTVRREAAKRRAEIIVARESGASLVEVGKKFGVSRQRVHQIVTVFEEEQTDGQVAQVVQQNAQRG